MDLDTLITYILLFLFFVLPSILKSRKKKKARPAPKTGKLAQKNSVLGRLGEAVQAFVRDLERQAQAAKKAEQKGAERREEPSPSFWESLDEGRDVHAEEGPGLVQAVKTVPEQKKPVSSLEDVQKPKAAPRQPTVQTRGVTRPSCSFPGGTSPSLSSLQQAVVWAEILDRPLALRGNQDRASSL